MDFYRPRYAIVNRGDIMAGVLPVHGGGTAMFVDHRDSETGRIHREIRPVAANTPHFILPGVGSVDEHELSEITAKMQEDGAAILRKSEEERGYVQPTAEMYQQRLREMLEMRAIRASGKSVSGPSYSREGSSTPWL